MFESVPAFIADMIDPTWRERARRERAKQEQYKPEPTKGDKERQDKGAIADTEMAA